ncbi:MAG: ribosome biogenesis GTPase RsgA [Pseudomonadota bacterium]
MMRKTRWIQHGILLLSLFLMGSAFARGDVSLDEAVESARSRTGGRVISAETQEWDGKQVHHIRLLTKEGKVKRIKIDSKSGRRLKGHPRQRDR